MFNRLGIASPAIKNLLQRTSEIALQHGLFPWAQQDGSAARRHHFSCTGDQPVLPRDGHTRLDRRERYDLRESGILCACVSTFAALRQCLSIFQFQRQAIPL